MGEDRSDETRVRDGNRDAWNAERYGAWVEALGPPEVEAARIVADPLHRLRRLAPHLGDVADKRICNVQGSHGRVAVALALLGAEVTVIDFAEQNRRYALEVAAAAGVTIDYRVCDVVESGSLGLYGRFDWLVMELGIFHYHEDLARFFEVMAALAAPGGRMLVNEFHPVERKLFQPGVIADYFRTELVIADVPNPTGEARSLGQCVYRYWTLGEIVSGAIGAGFRIDALKEHPGWTDPTIPGTFTLLATLSARR
jgi:2-polyprenyl-3-methyl-5-hydroxy-6-metoxy-1,4-benzoquinol methylase